MLTPTNNRLGGASSAALGTLRRLRGATAGLIDGVAVDGFLSNGASGSDPIDGGMIMGERVTYMVSKESLPTRPNDNASANVNNTPYTVLDSTDRDGYWALTLGDELA